MESKPFWQSKTVWANAITGLSLFFALPELSQVLPAGSMPYLLLANAALNIALRFISSTAVTVKK